MNRRFYIQFLSRIMLAGVFAFAFNYSYAFPVAEDDDPVPEMENGHIGGFLVSKTEQMDQAYGGGYSMYRNVYPLLKEYPGREFQSGLFGTWMHPYNETKTEKKMYTDIEGGLGWQRAREYSTEMPKFIMGGVQLNFNAWANGPGSGKGRDWSVNSGKYGVAQLSPWIIYPPDGLNIKQGTCSRLFGHGYLPLPLATPKSTTAGKNIPTGDQCWTLFLNTQNFKGPIAFFLPFFWSEAYLIEPEFSGKFLDQRPSRASKPFQQETQHIHACKAVDSKGDMYLKMATTQYPINKDGDADLLHRLMVYKKEAMWYRVKEWFEGGKVADTRIDISQAAMQGFLKGVSSSWKYCSPDPDIPKNKRALVNITDFMDFSATDSATLRFHWKGDLIKKTKIYSGIPIVELPQYYKWMKQNEKDLIGKWIAIDPESVPAETHLKEVEFKNKKERNKMAYITPEGPETCWKKPGPVAGPFKARLGDGSTITYYWYRFCDQPALLNADMTLSEREEMQRKVELLHKYWTKDKEYLPAPLLKGAKLAEVDPALIVKPPKGLEIGYVPIVTSQGIE